MMIYIKTNELYHYGVPRKSGRYKWGSGERPYQGDRIGGIFSKRQAEMDSMSNQDLKDYNSRRALEESYKKWRTKDDKLEATSRISNESTKIFNESSRQIDRAFQDLHKEEKSRIDLSAVSDADLKRIVNRMNMEQQYRNLSPTYVSKGETAIKQAFSILGSLTAITASSLGIALSIKQLMG